MSIGLSREMLTLFGGNTDWMRPISSSFDRMLTLRLRLILSVVLLHISSHGQWQIVDGGKNSSNHGCSLQFDIICHTKGEIIAGNHRTRTLVANLGYSWDGCQYCCICTLVSVTCSTNRLEKSSIACRRFWLEQHPRSTSEWR